jgi:hypothetical protein
LNNCKFVQYPHYCIVCKSQIDMKKIERYISDLVRYEHKPELMPPYKESDPIVVKDFGNDIEIECYENCFCQYVGRQLEKVDL